MIVKNRIKKYSEFQKIKKEWTSLWQNSNATIFSSFEWYNALIQAKNIADIPFEFNVVLYSKDGVLKCIAPLKIENKKIMFMSNHQADYQDFIYLSNSDCQKMLGYIISRYRNKYSFELDSIPGYSQLLVAASNKEYNVSIFESEICPILNLQNYNYSQALGSKNFKRKFNMLKKLGDISFVEFTSYNTLTPHLTTFKEFYRSRWGQNPESKCFFEPFDDFFIEELVKKFSPINKVAMFALLLNSTPIAYYFGFIDKTSYLFYRSGFDKKYEKYSPAMVLLKKMLAYFAINNYTVFDFLRGDYTYKSNYANDLRKNYCIKLETMGGLDGYYT